MPLLNRARKAVQCNGICMLNAFLAILRTAQACNLAVLMPRFIEAFPKSKDAPLTGHVDLWFIVHDGGILLLTAYLLLRSRVWSKCRLRVFVVTGEPDSQGLLKKVMTRFVYDLRISAEVEIVEMVWCMAAILLGTGYFVRWIKEMLRNFKFNSELFLER